MSWIKLIDEQSAENLQSIDKETTKNLKKDCQDDTNTNDRAEEKSLFPDTQIKIDLLGTR